eukprot:TRINITY_DN108471_c0_g1_i1.p1 TRINITY_DN108471_c0_g1~~TRINITY_DN108471_c0_g1_i1.p1  ORF type:complete len:692 (+),score=135.99 TRINITY_DN108471_c0_g1_i1:24-2078(+)
MANAGEVSVRAIRAAAVNPISPAAKLLRLLLARLAARQAWLLLGSVLLTRALQLWFRHRAAEPARDGASRGRKQTLVSTPSPSVRSMPSLVPCKSHAAVRLPRTRPRSMENFSWGDEDDRFEMLQKVDAGGQGTVYVCRRLKTGHSYAAKVIDTSSLERSERQLAMLRQEINIMRELHNRRIVNLHEHFWLEDKCIIVMDLAAGGNLFDKLDADIGASSDEPFRGLGGTEAASKHVAGQLLEGLGYMQAHHILHRDLKLENILITESRFSEKDKCVLHDIKIADFGLSKIHDLSRGTPALRRTMTAVGTPDYVAPEVLDCSYDERIDFWSFGVMLYAMLCGRMPFTIRSLGDPNQHKKEVSHIKDCDSWRVLSPEGRDLITGLLQVDPDLRYGLLRCTGHLWLASHCMPCAEAPKTAAQISRTACDEAIAGVVQEITGRTAGGLHNVEIQLRDGSISSIGNEGGAVQTSYVLAPDELIIALMQDIQHSNEDILGSALVFYTTKSRILALQGTEARTRRRFVAPQGRQIVGLQFDGPQVVGIHLERADSANGGAVEHICGRVGSAVDQVEFKLREGPMYRYGSFGDPGQTTLGPWTLQSDEFIVVAEQFFRDRKLGASLAFYTSHGRVFKLAGMTAVKSARFAAPQGRQICGVEFTDGDSGRLSKVITCSANGELQTRSSHHLQS